MDLFNNKKGGKKAVQDKKGNGSKKSPSPKRPFFVNVVSSVVIFLIIITLYSIIAENVSPSKEVPISEIASDISAGKVESISIKGDILEIKYTGSEEIKSAKKEEGTALSETLVNYGVPSEKISAVKIEVKNPSGVGYWLLNLAPFLAPILFIFTPT